MSLSDILGADLNVSTAPKLQPTEEQQLIIDAALNTSESLLINALAGAAKTTTLELICHALPVMPILSLAFNKRIAEEMARRLPGHVQCRTLNSLGHRVWAQTASGKIVVNAKKSYEILKNKVDSLKPQARRDAYEVFADTLKCVGRAKHAGYIPDGKYPQAHRLTSTANFWAQIDEDEVSKELVDYTLSEGIRQGYLGHIDFDDQIYLSTLFGGSFPRFPLVMCDEVQDLSAINHAMLEKLVTQRLIAVGDPYQSIYRFRGAVSSGMTSLKQKFNMREMGLSVSFRCPIAVIQNARFRAPHMMWPTWAKQGLVKRLETWDAYTLEDYSAIVCRNNGPLLTLAFKLLREGRNIKLVGFDVGSNLLRAFKKLGPPEMKPMDIHLEINKWENEKLEKGKSEATIREKAECLRVFASFGATLEECHAIADDMFKRSGPIQLMSGHKSKGLEWPTVYHLDSWRIPSTYAIDDEDLEQESNIRYVIETRAKESLYFINMNDYGKVPDDNE